MLDFGPECLPIMFCWPTTSVGSHLQTFLDIHHNVDMKTRRVGGFKCNGLLDYPHGDQGRGMTLVGRLGATKRPRMCAKACDWLSKRRCMLAPGKDRSNLSNFTCNLTQSGVVGKAILILDLQHLPTRAVFQQVNNSAMSFSANSASCLLLFLKADAFPLRRSPVCAIP